MDTKKNNKSGLVLSVILMLAALEGIVAIAVLVSIPGDEKNAWLLGLSPARWFMASLLLLGAASAVWYFWISIRNRKRFEAWMEKLSRLCRNPASWSAFIVVLFVGLLGGFSFSLNAISVSYTASSLRLLPAAIWISLICLQILPFLGWLFVREYKDAFKEIIPTREAFKLGLMIFTLSFVVRAVFAFPVINNNTPPKFDEFGYFEEIVGFENIARDVISGKYPSKAILDLTYNDGKWPPLHPLLLAKVNLIFNGGLALSRWTLVVLSSLTSVIVFAFGKALAGKKAGLASATFHILYPSFIAYAHFLWSETTYIFFLLLCLYVMLRVARDRHEARRIFFAVLAGLFLGMSGLVRTTSLPFLIVIPFWVLFARPRIPERGLLSTLIPVVCLLVWLPWLSFLQAKEGRFIPLAATGGYNLYLGNNPLGHYEDRPALVRNMDAYAKLNFIDRDLAARILAIQEIQRDPAGFIERSLDRVVRLWGSDTFLMRHIFNLAYPPIPPGITIWVWGFTILSYFSFWLFTFNGIVSRSIERRFKWLLLILVISGMTLPAISISITRLHLPLIAIMLPFTGDGIVSYFERWSRSKLGINILATAAILLLIGYTLPGGVSSYRPSGYYSAQMNRIEEWLNIEVDHKDRLAIRMTGENTIDIQLRILTDGYTFKENEERVYTWNPTGPGEELSLVLVSASGTFPVRIEISSPAMEEAVIIEPFDPDTWMSWNPTGLGTVEYSWTGGD